MKVYFDTIGCRLNQSEVEKMAGSFSDAGHEIVSSSADADLVIVNTCAVTNNAVADSRQSIRRSSRTKKAQIVVTGCWATLEPDAVMSLDGVVQVIPNAHKSELTETVLGILDYHIGQNSGRQALPGQKMRTRAFIKAQDGCNNGCTFCVTRVARGRSVSSSTKSILEDIQFAVESGVKEVVLTGVNLGSWGRDFNHPSNLKDLIKTVLADTDIVRLRLSSLEPWNLDEGFFELWENPRLCRHLHLSLQSGCDRTLERMRRRGDTHAYRNVVKAARQVSPLIAITTDIIVGFPGENENDFMESCKFIQEMEFASGHVFTFSPRQHTPAYSFADQVHPAEKKLRFKVVKELFNLSQQRYSEQFVDQSLQVLWERSKTNDGVTWQLSGLSDNYLRIRSESKSNLWNEISVVKLNHSDNSGMHGLIIY